MLIDGKPISGSIFDFGLYFFHNAKELLSAAAAVFLSAQMKSHLEARLWNDIFVMSAIRARRAAGSIKKARC